MSLILKDNLVKADSFSDINFKENIKMYKNTFYWRFSNELNFRKLQSPVSMSDFVRPRFKDLFPFFIFKIYKLSL